MLILNYIYMKFVTYGIPKKEPFIIENCDQENKDDDDAADDVLGMMFHSPKFSDITFIVGNYKKEFKAHKKRPRDPCQNTIRIRIGGRRRRRGLFDSIDKIVVRIPDFDEKNLEILLRYVYTKELEQNPKSEGRCYGIIDGLQIDLV